HYQESALRGAGATGSAEESVEWDLRALANGAHIRNTPATDPAWSIRRRIVEQAINFTDLGGGKTRPCYSLLYENAREINELYPLGCARENKGETKARHWAAQAIVWSATGAVASTRLLRLAKIEPMKMARLSGRKITASRII